MLTTVLWAITTSFGWWISNTHNKVNELQIEQAKATEVTSNIEEKINTSLKLKDDLQNMMITVARSQDDLEDIEQDLKDMQRDKFDMRDYEKYIKPVLEELISKANKLEQKTGSN